MDRRFVILLAVVLFFSMVFSGGAFAGENPRILILPFEINSGKDLSYLRTEIPEIVSKQLAKEDGILIDSSGLNLNAESKVSFNNAEKFGLDVSADYIVWGSFTRIGKKISVDIKLLKQSQKQPELIFAEGDDIDDLPLVVNRIAMDIGIRIFGFETIAEVVIKGNNRIEADAIFQSIKAKKGDRFIKAGLSSDLESIFDMGYFDDIRIESENIQKDGGGKRVIFTVQEKPTIKRVKIKGNLAVSSEKIEKELTISEGSILNSNKINSNIKQIISLYVEKHYHNTEVIYKTIEQDNNQVVLEFNIEEGEKVRIKEIKFIGNDSFKSKKLKKFMKTKQRSFFSWLASSDTLDMADLNTDIAILGAQYQKKGFIDIKIGDPEVKYEGKWIYITIKIEEGDQYKVGKVDLTGDLVLSKEDHLKFIKIKNEKFCDKEIIHKDILFLSDLFSNMGYANVDVNPILKRDPFKKTADIEFHINKGKQVFFEKIIIGGNIITRDKVIRRQLHVFEQELYSGANLKRSVRNLYRLDYFEDVQVNTVRGSSEDKVNLLIGVKEKPTGTFTFGMGYSSQEKFFGTLAVAKRNLFGRDQTLNLEGEIGEKSDKYSLSFIEPWLFDIPLSAKGEILKWKRDYDTYDKETFGGGITLGYPIYDYTRFYTQYSYEINTVSHITTDVGSIRAMAGDNITRSITNTIRYDSRDRAFNAQPTEGANHSFSVEYTGGFLEGDIHYTKYDLTGGYYYPLPYGFIGFAHGELGFIQNNDKDSVLPDYEKYYLGGSHSVRGFRWHDIAVRDEDGSRYGGEQKAQFNFELLRPLFGAEGFLGVLYHDLGKVYSKYRSMDLNKMRRGWGYGIRWFSPIGPIRCEYSYIIDPQGSEDKSGRFDFNMGGTF